MFLKSCCIFLCFCAGLVGHIAATGDMPAYHMRSTSSGLPQGMVMAPSPRAIHNPEQQAEATLKREVRLMKNRYEMNCVLNVRLFVLCRLLHYIRCLNACVWICFCVLHRQAARECRRKKKEYVMCLENRVAVLENQNKTLIEELRALKDIYCHKPE